MRRNLFPGPMPENSFSRRQIIAESRLGGQEFVNAGLRSREDRRINVYVDGTRVSDGPPAAPAKV